MTPTERMSGSTAKACQISRSRPASADLLAHDGVGPLQGGHLVGGDLADDAHPQARARGTAGATRSRRAGPARRPAARTSSLNRSRSGSTSSKSMSSGRPPTLWWLLILAAWLVARLDDVGVERALHQEAGVGRDRLPTSSKTRMNSSPMVLRFSSGSMTPSSRSKKRSAARTWISSMPWWRWKVSTTWSPSPSAHQAGVDEHARQLVADGPVHQGGGHRRVDPAGQAADGPTRRPTWARIGGDRRLDDRAHGPRGPAPAGLVEERARAAPGRWPCAPPRGGTAPRRSAGPDPRRRRPGCRGSRR